MITLSSPTSDVRFDHTIVPAHDRDRSATFFTRMFDLADPVEAGPFLEVRLHDDRIFEFAEVPFEFPGQHFAFLVDEWTFDRIVDRLDADGTPYWADPHQHRPGEINTNHGGRGVYFADPSGHHLEAMTVRYDGSRTLS